jgi:hypothetical protein
MTLALPQVQDQLLTASSLMAIKDDTVYTLRSREKMDITMDECTEKHFTRAPAMSCSRRAPPQAGSRPGPERSRSYGGAGVAGPRGRGSGAPGGCPHLIHASPVNHVVLPFSAGSCGSLGASRARGGCIAEDGEQRDGGGELPESSENKGGAPAEFSLAWATAHDQGEEEQ